MSNKMLVILIVVILACLGGIFYLFTKQPPPTANTKQQGAHPQAPTAFQLKETTVELSPTGFSPMTVTIKKNEGIIWRNKSGKKASINSADHPTHKKFPEINLGELDNNASINYVFTKPGTYDYHDHYNPQSSGKIIVE